MIYVLVVETQDKLTDRPSDLFNFFYGVDDGQTTGSIKCQPISKDIESVQVDAKGKITLTRPDRSSHGPLEPRDQ